MYWCFYCYRLNSEPSGPCVHCGRPLEGPPGLSYDDRLIWTLNHPDGDRAVLAAQTLGIRGVREALPALRDVVDDSRDPYRAAAALRSAIKIAGVGELRDWLERLTRRDSFMISEVAQRALSERRGDGPPGAG